MCRLAQHYQLQLVSAKTILAAANELGGPTKQVSIATAQPLVGQHFQLMTNQLTTYIKAYL